jgi:transcriptional regulator with XRE-family HTH domain
MTVGISDEMTSEGTPEDQRTANRKVRYRLLREERNLDHAGMAAALNVAPNTWWFWERRGRMPRNEHLRKLHDLTGRDYLYLRGE